MKHGIYNLENIITEELAADKVYEFAFSFAPLRLKGASGSPGNPMQFDRLSSYRRGLPNEDQNSISVIQIIKSS